MKTLLLTVIGFCLAAASTQAADVFDRHTTYWLKQVAKDTKPVATLAMDQAVRLKGLDQFQSSPCLVIKTNDGNWAKVQIGFGFRRGPDAKPFPVLLIERFVTYRADRDGATNANGSDVLLFAGFSFNFDIGQVVPSGQGGDIRFTEKSEIQSIDEAQLYAMNGSRLPKAKEGSKPDPRNRTGVLATDFAGTWKVNANGRWKGELQLNVENNGRSHGTYTSDESKSQYDVTGRISGSPHHMKLQLHLDNATQTFDAYLWTTNKSAMAGTTMLAERRFGFFATRVIEGQSKQVAKP